MSSIVKAEAIKTLGYAGISTTYAAVGIPTTHEIRLVCITNTTAGDLYFTTDTKQDEYFVAAGANKLLDLQANNTPKTDAKYVYEKGTQFYVKQIEAPVSKAVYIECLY